MTAEAWIALAGIAMAVVGAVFATYMALSAKLARVAAKVDFLIEGGKENREAHEKIWDRLDDHGQRITTLEAHEGTD